MVYDIIIKVSAIRDLKELDPSASRKIIAGIVKFFSRNHTHKPKLKGKLNGFYSFLVGDYRIIYTITKSHSILIMKIAHRKNVYR